MSTDFYVYVFLDPDSKLPFYVGKGKGRRYRQHFFDKIEQSKSNKLKINKINKILKDDKFPIVEKVIENITEEEALLWETLLICFWGRRIDNSGILTNICSFGHGRTGLKHSKETKKIISEKNSGRKHSIETKEKIRNSKLGLKFSKESREKMSLAKRNMSEHTKEKLRQIALNRPPATDQYKENARNAMLGYKWYNNGISNKRVFPNDTIPINYFVGKIRTNNNIPK